MGEDYGARAIAVRAHALGLFAAQASVMVAKHLAESEAGWRKLLTDLQGMVPANLGQETDQLRQMLDPARKG